jgi:hypothetical protein
VLGFPIRTSPDQRLVGDSPRLNAASHVLHRLLMPRHPPCALKNLATKMLASTMQISNNKQPTTHHKPPFRPARHDPVRGPTDSKPTPTGASLPCPFPQDPTVCPAPATPRADLPTPTPPKRVGGTGRTADHAAPNSQCSTSEPPCARRSLAGTTWTGRLAPTRPVLLRKEVIQPHLPVRLPCYDFVPIASPTFDRSPQQAGWATGFGCCRLS